MQIWTVSLERWYEKIIEDKITIFKDNIELKKHSISFKFISDFCRNHLQYLRLNILGKKHLEKIYEKYGKRFDDFETSSI
ncbi:uncharacterized protein V1478_018856 [Vespula squamosa]|uniref:Uncharacterized protein n=1 Tax=Vespula squamosa TaxID=30214 RepID=A0ABD1ZWB6_VESSQ